MKKNFACFLMAILAVSIFLISTSVSAAATEESTVEATPTPAVSAEPNALNTPAPGETTPVPADTPVPDESPIPEESTASEKSTETETKTETEIETEESEGVLKILCRGDNGQKEDFVITITGTTNDGEEYEKDYSTAENGRISVAIPAGEYTATPKDSKYANEGFDLPDSVDFTVTAGETSSLSFYFKSNIRELTLTVVDDDGIPLEDVEVAIYDAAEIEALTQEQEESSATESDVTDVVEKIKESSEAEEDEKKRANPYARKNAISVKTTDENGEATFSEAPVTKLIAVVLEAPEGYTAEVNPTEIAAGIKTKAEVLCEYIKIDVSFVNDSEEYTVVGAQVTLYDEDDSKLDTWITKTDPHRLIRVPEGEYTITLSYDGQEDEVYISVENEITEQEQVLKTSVTGSEVPAAEEATIRDYIFLILRWVISPLLLIAVVILIFVIVRRRRRRSGGIR